MSKRKCLLEVAWLGVLIAGVASTPAAAMCWGSSEFLVSEVEVLSCQPSAPRLDKALAEERKKGQVPADRAGRLGQEAATVVLLEVRSIRDRVFPKDPRRDPSAQGVWKDTKIQEPRQILFKQSSCAKLAGKKIHMISDMPCCDIRPSPDLACVVSLWQGRLAPPELVGEVD